jgi:hypothetical protein
MAKTLHRRTLQVLFFISALFFIQGLLSPRAVQAQATVSIGSISDAKVNSQVEVPVNITNPSGLAGFQFDLKYDPQVVVATGVTAGNLLPAGGTFIDNINNAAGGTIRVFWMKSASSPVISGNGELCRISFRVLSSGSTELDLKNLELVNQAGNLVNFNTLQKGSISTVGSNSAGSNSGGKSSSGNVSITTASALPYAYRDTYYSCSLAAAGGTGNNYIWERTSGSLPPGLTLDSDGIIYGTPRSVGRYDFTLEVTNDGGRAEEDFTLWVLDDYQVPYLYDDYGSDYGYSDRVTFKNLRISQGSMEMNLSPENMPYTMVVDSSINRINLLVSLNASGDILYINNARHTSSEVKSIPLAAGTNEISFYVRSAGKSSDKYFLTIYKMPGRR